MLLRYVAAGLVLVPLSCNARKPDQRASQPGALEAYSAEAGAIEEIEVIESGLTDAKSREMIGRKVSIKGKAMNLAKGLPKIELPDGTGTLVSIGGRWPSSAEGKIVKLVGTADELPPAATDGERLSQGYSQGAYYLRDCKWFVVGE